MAGGQCAELFTPGDEECIGTDHERLNLELVQPCKDRIEVAFATGMQDVELQPECTGRRLQVFHTGLGEIRAGRVDEQSNDCCRRD